MNSAVVALVGIVWLVAAYRVYGRLIERKLIEPNDANVTPAHRMEDGVDYYPARPIVLFGHHFASIAGAGPIIGPVIAAAAFGWGVSLIWILVGVIIVGAVHDYTTLMVSVRHDGRSIPDITREVIGPRARALFQVFVWITLIFVIAVFVLAAAKSFIADARIVIPAFGLIPLAMIFGWLVNRLGLPLWLGTVAALGLLVGLFFMGMNVPVALPFEERETAIQVWIGILILYGVVAAVLPVWILLQPRDYIAYWILVVGMLTGFVGLFVTHKPIDAPFMTGLVSETQGPIWPMLFILIACGAVSGFHSLVSSGTTAKQLSKESHGKPIAFGAMVTEGGLALLALLAVTAGLAHGGGEGGEAGPPTLQSFLGKGGGGPIAAFATGFGVFTEPFMGTVGALFGMTMLNAFVLTTLDTSVRLARFITAELVGPVFKPMKNRYLSTIVVAVFAYGVAASGSEGALWPMFGAANQLVAALAMIVVTAYLVKKGKPCLYTLLPAIFMLLTTCGALVWKGYSYLVAEEPNYSLATAAGVLLCLAVYVGISGFGEIKKGE
ncbi:MAG: carbon starvation protein A [Deltaproteobacteria bacterium]|nr:carbon starvation protein A [Deltaproteobacteria bacterium]